MGVQDHRTEFETSDVRVAVSPLDSVEIANDRHRLYEEGRRPGLPLPASRHAISLDELHEALVDLRAHQSPVVIKKRFSTVLGGCNVPLWTVLPAMGRPFTVSPPTIGVRYHRYWTSIIGSL